MGNVLWPKSLAPLAGHVSPIGFPRRDRAHLEGAGGVSRGIGNVLWLKPLAPFPPPSWRKTKAHLPSMFSQHLAPSRADGNSTEAPSRVDGNSTELRGRQSPRNSRLIAIAKSIARLKADELFQ